MHLSTIFLIIFLVNYIHAIQELPEKFLGRWKIEKDENFDAILKEKGYPWLIRKLIASASITKVFERSDKVPQGFNYKILTFAGRDVNWQGIVLGEEHVGKYVDGTIHKVIYIYDLIDDQLNEAHQNLDKPHEKVETFSYKRHQNYLINRLEYNGVVARRWYRKIE